MNAHSTVRKQFFRYVSQNILGMIGVSAYILADTFFIAQAQGADGIAALNLVLPVYSLIFALGAMLATGAATRFALERHEGKHADGYLAEALTWAGILSVPFILLGIFSAEGIVRLLGGEPDIVTVGAPYTRIFLLFTPFFMCNYILRSFVLNDGDPSLAMTATMASSLFNIVMDWVLMFPLGMGMAGAALATATSPIVGVGINALHFRKKTNTLCFRWHKPTFKLLAHVSAVGVSGFIGEIAGGMTTMVLNFLILGLSGSIGVAAYGVVANVAIVATAIFSGISQGSQPLLSDAYSRGETGQVRQVLMMSILTALTLSVLMIVCFEVFTEPLVAVFNSEHDPVMADLACQGMRLYFLGYLIVNSIQMGANIDYAIVISSHYTDLKKVMRPKEAMVAALNESFPTIFTSGSILASAGILISVLTTNPVISAIGTCLGRGTIVSILLVLFVLPQILILGDTIIERTSFEMKGVGGITRTASGTMHVNGRVRGYINGVVDAEIKGVLHGQFNASIATGTQLTVEKPDMYLSEENVRETADNPDTTDDTAKGGDAE